VHSQGLCNFSKDLSMNIRYFFINFRDELLRLVFEEDFRSK